MRILCGSKRHTYKGVRAFLTDERTVGDLQVVEVFPKIEVNLLSMKGS